MRIPSFVAAAFFLQACTGMWETDGPNSPPGDTGITAEGKLMEGPEAVSSLSKLPHYNEEGAVPPFAAQDYASAYEFASGYRVGAGDHLSIRVARETELSGEYVVDPAGVLSLPNVQSVPVAGLTSADFEQLIVQKLHTGYLRHPKVSVQPVNLRTFFIMGEVTTAGSFPHQGGLTVQQAIAPAGGYTQRANYGHVLITGRNATGTKTFKVTMSTQVYPGDIVFVRQRWL